MDDFITLFKCISKYLIYYQYEHILIIFLVQQQPSMQQTAQQREFLRQQEEYRRQQQQAADAQRQNEIVQQQLQQEQDRLAREREHLQLQKEQIAREQLQRQQEPVSVKDTVRGILESSKFGNDFGFERPKSAGGGSRVTEVRIICCGLYSFMLSYNSMGCKGHIFL